MYGVEELREKISTDDRWAVRALLRIYAEQTPAEQFAGEDIGVRNGRGFTPFDAAALSMLAEQVLEYRRLSRAKADALRRIMPKYAKQLVRLIAADELDRLSLTIDNEMAAYRAATTRRTDTKGSS